MLNLPETAIASELHGDLQTYADVTSVCTFFRKNQKQNATSSEQNFIIIYKQVLHVC